MANENEEEYEFTDLEDTDIFTAEEEAPAVKPESQMKRNVIIALVVIGVGLAVYKLLGIFAGGTATTTISQAPTQLSKPAQKLAPKLEAPKVTTVVPPTVTTMPVTTRLSVPTTDVNNMKSRLQRLENQATNANTSINQLSAQIVDLKKMIGQLNQSLMTVDKNLSKLEDKIKVRKISRQARRAKRVRPRAPSGISTIRRPELFYIQAIIPGRAWLKSSKGSTLTVGVNDRLSGYGHVTKIDSDSGRVYTSSGRQIRFHPEDR